MDFQKVYKHDTIKVMLVVTRWGIFKIHSGGRLPHPEKVEAILKELQVYVDFILKLTTEKDKGI